MKCVTEPVYIEYVKKLLGADLAFHGMVVSFNPDDEIDGLVPLTIRVDSDDGDWFDEDLDTLYDILTDHDILYRMVKE